MKKYYYVKCIIDFISALISLILLLPLLILISIIIAIDSSGPIVFKQQRLGQNGKTFNIYKFRTMVDDAIHKGSGLSTHESDPRITKVGKILRKTSLDELPQIINVFKGDMSFIGPRPPVPYHPRHYDEYDDKQKKRFLLKPGISGYSQVKVRNSLSWDERIPLDIIYVENYSLKFDLLIFLKTFNVFVNKKDIYHPK